MSGRSVPSQLDQVLPRFSVQKPGQYHPFGRIRIAPFGKGVLRILGESAYIWKKVGIPFTHVGTPDSVEGWKARQGIPSLGLIILGRFRSSTRGLAARRRAGDISGGFAGRMALSAPTARQWASRGKCREACCPVEPAIGRYR